VKVIIQIPCFNEAEGLPDTLSELPRTIPGASCVETLVIDDGSSDDTVAVAESLGVDHIIRHRINLGLARAFQSGLDACLRLGADIVVNTDADNQYPGRFIPALVEPILRREADVVIGDRQIARIAHFSPVKRMLQNLGSWMVRTVSRTNVPDAASGFRAYSRDAALRMNILTRFSYTLETIIQAGRLGLSVVSIPIQTNAPLRPSRLQRNMWHFVKAQAGTIVRLYAFYEPLRTFGYISLPFFAIGVGSWIRFFYFFAIGQGGKIQSITIGTGLFLVGMLVLLFGIQADIASKHRQLTQEVLFRLKKMDLDAPHSEDKARRESLDFRHSPK
jgi:glycosyltransferase involved in cell wall biosynthesis